LFVCLVLCMDRI